MGWSIDNEGMQEIEKADSPEDDQDPIGPESCSPQVSDMRAVA